MKYQSHRIQVVFICDVMILMAMKDLIICLGFDRNQYITVTVCIDPVEFLPCCAT